MTNATNTSGGAAIGGNVNSDEFVGRDKTTTNNITVVIQLLHTAQINDILAAIKGDIKFSSIVETVEEILGKQLSDDLADATAWAGEILGELLNKYISADKSFPVRIRSLVAELPKHVCDKLKANGYWREYRQRYDHNKRFPVETLWLDATTMLLTNNMEKLPPIGIANDSNIRFVYLSKGYASLVKELPIEELEIKDLRAILAGIILDLIRIKSDNTISVQFLQELANMVKPSK